MGSVDDALASLNRALEQTNEAINATREAESEADDAVGQMIAAGVDEKAQEVQAFHDTIEQARTHLGGGVNLIEEAIALGQAAKG